MQKNDLSKDPNTQLALTKRTCWKGMRVGALWALPGPRAIGRVFGGRNLAASGLVSTPPNRFLVLCLT